MRLDPRKVALNAVARCSPAVELLRRMRDRGRPAEYEKIADHVLDLFKVRSEWFGARVPGAQILEIGSGSNFGLALLLLHAGARRVVNVEIERYGFIDDAALYERIVERARAAGIDVAWPPPGTIAEARSRALAVDRDRVALHLGRSAARIPEDDAVFDVTFSVSVLQHVRREDLARVAKELFRVTRPGGVGYHRIHFADLMSAEPFRHLCYTDRQYRLMFQHRSSYSNRYGMDDFERVFRGAGFAAVEFEDVVNEREEELDRWLPRFSDEFRARPRSSLRASSCMLVLRK